MISRHSQTGVKLWEVTVVLALTALIAAILFPVFNKVHEGDDRHRGACQSNLKQLGLALIQYAHYSDEAMPAGVNSVGNGWAGEIYSFTKSTGLYQCPFDATEGSHISYAENQNGVKQNIADFVAPAATVELYEFTILNCNPSDGYSAGPNSSLAIGPMEMVSATGLAAPQDSKRHDSDTYSLNFLAMDGHVKYLKPAYVSNRCSV